jgi:hypothetical protein
MPLGAMAGEVLGGLSRIIGRMLGELLLEIMVKGVGYLICRPFQKNIDPDGMVVKCVGFIAWAALGLGGYFAYNFVAEQLAIDRCLDSGGRYNHDLKSCET